MSFEEFLDIFLAQDLLFSQFEFDTHLDGPALAVLEHMTDGDFWPISAECVNQGSAALRGKIFVPFADEIVHLLPIGRHHVLNDVPAVRTKQIQESIFYFRDIHAANIQNSASTGFGIA